MLNHCRIISDKSQELSPSVEAKLDHSRIKRFVPSINRERLRAVGFFLLECNIFGIHVLNRFVSLSDVNKRLLGVCSELSEVNKIKKLLLGLTQLAKVTPVTPTCGSVGIYLATTLVE